MSTSTKPSGAHKAAAHRMSVSFDQDQYEELARLAEQKKVSVAWVIREAIDTYLTQEEPLFRAGNSA